MSEALRFSEFAKRVGCRPGYVSKLRDAGRLVLTPDGRRILYDESIARMRATASPDKAAVAARHARTRGAALATAPDAAPAPATAPQRPMYDDTPDPTDDDRPTAPDEGRAGSVYQNARALRERYLAAQAKLDYQERVGQLVDAAEVTQVAADLGATVRRRLEGLPDILAGQVSDRERDRVYSLATDHIELILTDLARHLSQIAKPKENA